MAERKFFTFLNITEGKDDVKNCTVALTLTRPELRELQDGKKVLTCPAAISNRDKILSDALGTEIKSDNDTVWCDVQFWNVLAERFQKFLGERDKVRVIICGRLSLRTWTAKDGTPAQRVQISANDWFALPTATATTATATVADQPNFEEVSTDDDLPF